MARGNRRGRQAVLGPIAVLVVAGAWLGNPFGVRDGAVDAYMGLASRIAQDQADKFRETSDRQLNEMQPPTPSTPTLSPPAP